MKKLALKQIWKSEIPEEQIPRIGYKSSGIFRLQLTPDNRFAVTLSYQHRELIVWDFISGEKLFNMHIGNGYDKVYDLYLSPDGHYCVVTGETFRVVPISSDYQKPSHPFPSDYHVIANAKSEIALCCNGHQVQVWDFKKKQFSVNLEILSIKRDDETWNPLKIESISNNGELGAGMFDSHALIWDLKTGKLLWQHNFNNRRPRNIIFTPNNQQVVIDNGSIIETWYWDKDQVNSLALNTNSGKVYSPVFTPNGENLIVGTDDGAIQIWDWEKGELQKTLGGHKYPIECLSVSNDGEFIASTSDDSTLRKWHIPTGRQIFSTLNAEGNPKQISVDPTGNYAITPYGHDNASLAIYKLENGKVVQKLQGHHGNINAIDYLANEKIVTASDDHTLRVWDIKSGECLKILSGEHHGRVQTAVVTEHKEKFISASSDGKIVLWDLQKNNLAKLLFEYTPPKSWTEQYIQITQNGKIAITNKAGENLNRGLPILLDLENQNELFKWHGFFMPSGGSIGGILSPQGHWLVQVQGVEWNVLKVINLKTQQNTLYEIANRLCDFWCFTSDEEKLVCSSNFNKILVFDLKSGNFDFVSIQNDARITALSVSPNNKLGAIAADKQIRIWNISNSEELVSLNTDQIFFNLVFDPNNRYLLASGSDMLIHCFELKELIN